MRPRQGSDWVGGEGEHQKNPLTSPLSPSGFLEGSGVAPLSLSELVEQALVWELGPRGADLCGKEKLRVRVQD